MTQNLKRYNVAVRRCAADGQPAEHVAVAASSPLTARIIATERVRVRHGFPTSVTLFSEVV